MSDRDAGAELASGMLADTLGRIFNDTSGPQARQTAEAVGWAGECWQALAEAGLPWVGVPEEAGGSGGTFLDAATLVRAAGRHAVPLPVSECAITGGWMAAAAGLRLPEGPLSTPVPAAGDHLRIDGAGRVYGRLGRVPWGGRVAAVAALAESSQGQRAVLVEPAAARVTPGRNLAGEPRDGLVLDSVAVPSERVAPTPGDLGLELCLRGSLSRALLMAGAMESAAELTVGYAEERHQFGRAIGSFQAVAQRLVQLASEMEAAALAAEVAARRFADTGTEAAFEVTAARATASRAASAVAAHAHQVHGAVGMTQEYTLHHFTRRLWAWRQEWGSERRSSEAVGRRAVAARAEGLWPLVTSGLVAG